MIRVLLLLLVPIFTLAAAPASAAGGAIVPDPSDLALFALGLLGVIIGHRSVRMSNRKGRDREGDR